jgi:two-component system cell cycle response regulator DivK
MSQPRVLVVDDNDLNVEMVSFLLGQDGQDVQAVRDYQGVLAALPGFQPHLILMDMQLPHVDGLEITRRLRADAAYADLVIVAFTAYAMKGDEAKMLAAGCNGYLSKPIDVARFAAQVRSYLPAF